MVSIIIPAYNAQKYIGETLDSVLSQSYKDWELILVDDGSTDNTAEIIKEKSEGENRIKYYYQKNLGVSTARNYGLKKSIGEFVAFLDADDVWLPLYLEKKVNYLLSHPTIGAVNSKVTFIDGESKAIEGFAEGMRNEDVDGILTFNTKNKTTGPSGILCRKECVKKIGGFNIKLSNTADKMFYLDLSKETTIVNLDEFLWLYRFHDASMHKNILNMINDYENYIQQLESKSYFNSKKEASNFKKYIYKICYKESMKQKHIKYSVLFLFKYIFS